MATRASNAPFESARKNLGPLIVARTKVLIAGRGVAEALRHASRAQEAAVADMFQDHSNQKTHDEIESFIDNWAGKARIVIVPTAHPRMTEARARALGKVRILI